MALPEIISDLEQVVMKKKQEHGDAVLSFSFPWKTISLLNLLGCVEDQARVYWHDPQTGIKIAGMGMAAQIRAGGSTRFVDIENAAARLFEDLIVANHDLPEFARPRILGGFSFGPNPNVNGDVLWGSYPPAYFILPRLVMTQKGDHTWVTVNQRLNESGHPLSLKQVQNQVIAELKQLLDSPLAGTLKNLNPSLTHSSITIRSSDVPEKSHWLNAVAQTSAQIRDGDFQKAVLSRARIYHPPVKVSPAQITRRLENRYPACYIFWIEPHPGRAFCGATPELLAEVRQRTFATTALAGSTARGRDAHQDQKLGQQLMGSAKNLHEHRLVVENIHARLDGCIDGLQGPKWPQLRKLANIQHLETPIYGRLKSDTTLLTLVDRLHPTPAMGGSPQEAALQHINALEPHDRGWYAAPVGWLGLGGEGTFAVGIRSAIVGDKEITAFAGAGIMATSNPEKEWLETEMKLNPLLDAVKFACHENNLES